MKRFALTLNLSHACPLSCHYCYAGKKISKAMSFETAMAGVELALASKPELLDISFFGGEPLLEWPLLQGVVEATKIRTAKSGARLRFTLTTSGILLNEERARWLAQEKFEIGLSLDGDRRSQDLGRLMADGSSSFEATLAGLHIALPTISRVEVIMVLTPENAAYVAEGLRFLFREGARFISFNPNLYVDWPPESQALLSRAMREVADFFVERYLDDEPFYLDFIQSKIITRLKGGYACGDQCQFGADEVAVAPSGRLYPCERLVGDDTGEMAMGHVETGFDELVRLQFLQQRGNDDPECARCSLKERCMNWCGCVNYASTGLINRASDFNCFYEKLCIQEADRAATRLWAAKNPAFLKRFYGMG